MLEFFVLFLSNQIILFNPQILFREYTHPQILFREYRNTQILIRQYTNTQILFRECTNTQILLKKYTNARRDYIQRVYKLLLREYSVP